MDYVPLGLGTENLFLDSVGMSDLIAAYIRVTDLGRAEAFYRRLFARAALMAGPSFTFFDINGKVFGLLEAGDESKCERWCKPSAPHLKIEVADLKVQAARLAMLAVPIIKPLSDVGHLRSVQFRDTEGNTIELYQTMFALD